MFTLPISIMRGAILYRIRFFKHSTFLSVLCTRPFIDERTITFDNDLFDVYLSMPPQFRLKGRVYKKAIKKLAPEFAAIPNSNTGFRADTPIFLEWLLMTGRRALRKFHILPHPHTPHPAFTTGSWPDKSELIRSNEKLKKLVWDTIHNEECINPEIFNTKNIENMFFAHLEGREDFTNTLLLLLTFGTWYKKYGPGK